MKKIRNPNTGNEDIQSGYKDGIWHKKYAMLIMKNRQMTEGTEQPNQEKIRTLGEKEIYKYLGILEAGTIKQA